MTKPSPTSWGRCHILMEAVDKQKANLDERQNKRCILEVCQAKVEGYSQ
jgi:hypothetical protein